MVPIETEVHGNMVTTSAAHPLSFAIGQFLVNCGLLEFETYVWIHGFGSDDAKNLEESKDELFTARKRRVLRIVDGLPIASEIKAAVSSVWEETIEVMAWRNIVAHNPILAQYHGPDAKNPWNIRLIDAKTMGTGNLREYDVAEINAWTNRAHDVSKRLINFREVIGGGQIQLIYEP